MNPSNNSSNSNSSYNFGNNFNTNQSNFGSNYPSSPPQFDNFQDHQSSSNFKNDMSFVGSRDFGTPPPPNTTPSSNFNSQLPGTAPPGSNTQAPMERRNNRPNRLSYEEFVKQKIPAFLYYSKHPDTAELFVRSDVDEFNKLNDAYNKLASGVYFASCFLTFSADNWLRYKSIIYGMTYRTSLLKLLIKFWVIPTAVTGAASGLFIDDMYQPKMDTIAKRYNYADYIFRTAYEKGEISKNFQSAEKPQVQTNTNIPAGGFPSFINPNTNGNK